MADITQISVGGTTYNAKDSGALRSHPTISVQSNTTSTASPSAGSTVTMIDSITKDSNGHVTKINTKTVTLPSGGSSGGGTTTLSDLGITATATELNYVDGVTSAIQTQLNNKSASNHTHTAVSGYTISVVSSLPSSPNSNTIYFVVG